MFIGCSREGLSAPASGRVVTAEAAAAGAARPICAEGFCNPPCRHLLSELFPLPAPLPQAAVVSAQPKPEVQAAALPSALRGIDDRDRTHVSARCHSPSTLHRGGHGLAASVAPRWPAAWRGSPSGTCVAATPSAAGRPAAAWRAGGPAPGSQGGVGGDHVSDVHQRCSFGRVIRQTPGTAGLLCLTSLRLPALSCRSIGAASPAAGPCSSRLASTATPGAG